ncbi:squalene epoxidase-domain-containing protein [Aspergillus karnatakaensis]|uniref:pentatricopeptide repeat protein n=1 Tax=Aspergillus karnatakaensis TaxID=1810916 RepID=UPI003CCD23CF
MPAHGPPAVPSRNALRVLRKLALAGSTVGSFCTVAAITYDAHRRVTVAERIVENKRALQTSAPRYDATSAAKRLSRMMEAAEAGEFMGLEAWKAEERKFQASQSLQPATPYEPSPPFDQNFYPSPLDHTEPPSTFEPGSELEHELEPEYNPALSKESPEITANLEMRIESNLQKGIDRPARPRALRSSVTKYLIRQPDENVDATFLESNLGTASEAHLALEERMQTLFKRRQWIDAAQIFLDEHPATEKGISSDRREQAENVFIARSVFERLEEVDRISPTMWKVLIIALAKKGCIESAATIYVRYKDIFPVHPMMLDVVLRCLLESRRLTTAKWLLLGNLTHDNDCGLAGAYLTGLWRKTRSIELMNGQFTKVLTILRRLDKSPTEKLVNPMVKAYVDTGRYADAEALVHEMRTTYLVPLSCRTKGLLVVGKALQCDWTAVDEGLDEMRDLGLTKKKRDFIQIFDRIFLEYWVTHTADEIRDFLYRNIDKFDIIPDQVLYKHILEAVVEKGNQAMLSEFVDLARQRGWKVSMNEDEILKMLHGRRAALQDSPVGFWQMLHSAREEGIRATASQQFLGYDPRSSPSDHGKPTGTGDIPMAWYKRTLDQLTQPSRPVDNYQKLQDQMAHHMHVGKVAEALQCFQNAEGGTYHLKPREIELALIAAVLEHGLARAQALLQDSWTDSLPLFCAQIRDMEPSAEAEHMKMAIFRFYNVCWYGRKMIVKHHITSSTTRRLIESGKPELALDLLASVYMSKYGRWQQFDGVCMKMFLRAFAATNNLPGIRWCILTAISRGSALNRDLVVEAHRVIGSLRRDAAANSMPRQQARRLAVQLNYLGFAVHILTSKCDGNPKYTDLRGNPAAKQSYRRKLKSKLDEEKIWKDKSRFDSVIAEWDEEYELDKVLDRIDNDEQHIFARWNEATYAAEQRRRIHHDADIVIVGAGVLGCALAVALGNQGRSVLLLEYSLKEPDRIVGELLQPGGVSALEQLGLRDCLEGIEAIPTEGYYVTYRGDPVTIPYPVQSPGAPPPEGRSFHHGRFVMKLREAARACPNVTIVETKVTDLITCSHTKQVLGVECVTKEKKDCYFGQLTVCADGYASKFRKQYHPYTPKVKSKFWGLELIDAELPQPHYGHVLLNPNNPPILIYQIGTHETRILCDIPENLPSASVKNGGVKGHLRNVVLPSLPKSVQPSFAAALDKNQLRSMPNSFLPSATNKTPGLIILGDALNMRHPLTGGGMTVALNDVLLIRELLSPESVPRLSDTALVLKQLSTFQWRRKMGASVINILAQALYSLFAADDDNLKALQRGCFQYFRIGMYKQPVEMLGGMLKKPQVLFAHFFTVAFLSLWMIIRESPLYQLPVSLIRCALVFWTACVVIFPYMVIEAFC